VVHVALKGLVPERVEAEQSTVGPTESVKLTVPVGVPVPVTNETVAVNVTGWPEPLGLALLTKAVEVVPWLTVYDSVWGLTV
jgi:hypothetical protein